MVFAFLQSIGTGLKIISPLRGSDAELYLSYNNVIPLGLEP